MKNNSSNNFPKLAYSVAEAAKLLSISENHAWVLVGKGIIPSVRLGDRRLIPAVELEKLLKVPEAKTA